MASANPRAPVTCARNRSRRSGSRDATAPTGQPARSRATPERDPDRPGADDPDDGPVARTRVRVRVGVVAAGRRRVLDVPVAVLAGRGRVEGDALLVELAQGLLVVGVASLGGAPEHVVGLVPRPHRGPLPVPRRRARGTIPRNECSERSEGAPSSPDPPWRISHAQDQRIRRPSLAGRRASRTSTGSTRSPTAGLALGVDLGRSPVTLKILLENALRHAGGGDRARGGRGGAGGLAPGRRAARPRSRSCPARVVLQDFTGVPAVVDLAAMRDAMADLGGDPAKVNPLVPADLVIDHSVQVDAGAAPGAFAFNVEREYERNGERYQLLRWAQTAFRDLRVVPPGHGHHPPGQPRVPGDGRRPTARTPTAGSPSRTRSWAPTRTRRWSTGSACSATASAASRPRPSCSASRCTSRCPGSSACGSPASCRRRSTATDLVLVITEMLRAFGVVGSFVEFAGDGLAGLALADRATISNMSPEFGATATLFPIDDETLAYLRLTGRTPARVDLVERYAKAQGLWREPGDGPEFDVALELDLATRRAVAGRPAAAPGPGRAARPSATNFRDGVPADRGRRRAAPIAGGGRRAAVRARRRSRSPRSRRARTRPTRR